MSATWPGEVVTGPASKMPVKRRVMLWGNKIMRAPTFWVLAICIVCVTAAAQDTSSKPSGALARQEGLSATAGFEPGSLSELTGGALRSRSYWEGRTRLGEFEEVEPGGRPGRFERYAEVSPRYEFKLEFVPLRGGRVEVSSGAGTKRTVDVADLWVGRTEVPCEAYEPFMVGADLSPAALRAQFEKPDHEKDRPLPDMGCFFFNWQWWKRGHPAYAVSRKGAEAYCSWLSEKTGRKYRLPTEAEFEHFARAGADTEPRGEALLAMAWCRDNAPRPDPARAEDEAGPQAVGTRRANAWGLYDVMGNVAEHATPAGEEPQVVRGGSWRTAAEQVSWRMREAYSPAWQELDPRDPKLSLVLIGADFVGFRIVRERQ